MIIFKHQKRSNWDWNIFYFNIFVDRASAHRRQQVMCYIYASDRQMWFVYLALKNCQELSRSRKLLLTPNTSTVTWHLPPCKYSIPCSPQQKTKMINSGMNFLLWCNLWPHTWDFTLHLWICTLSQYKHWCTDFWNMYSVILVKFLYNMTLTDGQRVWVQGSFVDWRANVTAPWGKNKERTWTWTMFTLSNPKITEKQTKN